MYEETSDFINVLFTNTGSLFSDYFWFFTALIGAGIAFWSIIQIIKAVVSGVKRL